MTTRKKMPIEISIYLRYLHQDKGIKCSLLCKRFTKYPQRTIYYHANLPIGEKAGDKRKFNKGRPEILTTRDKRCIMNAIPKLRKDDVSFTSKRLKLEAGIADNISDRTVRRCLNKQGFGFRQLRKKGLLTPKDLKIREEFAKKVWNIFPPDFWTKGISVGWCWICVGFAHKNNPKD